jgi:hypothetical protein
MGGLHGIHEFWFHEYVIRKSEVSIASSGKSEALIRPARALMRGRNAIVTERWRGLRWTLWRQVLSPDETSAAYGEVVWSWRRDPGATLAGSTRADNGGKKGRSPGRARISRKTIARGKPGCLGCTCSSTRVLSFATLAHGTAGAVGARLSLRPLLERGTTKMQNPGKTCYGNENPCSPRHCERSEAIHLSALGAMDCLVAIALLAMTTP